MQLSNIVIVIAWLLRIYRPESEGGLRYHKSLATVLSLLYIPPDWSAQRRRPLPAIDLVPKWAWLQVAVTSRARRRYSDDVT